MIPTLVLFLSNAPEHDTDFWSYVKHFHMVWYLGGGEVTKGSDHIDFKSPWNETIRFFIDDESTMKTLIIWCCCKMTMLNPVE